MRKTAWGLCLTAAFLGLLLLEAGGQDCGTPATPLTGYAGGDPSTLSRLIGVSIDAAQRLSLSNRVGNFRTPMSGFDLTSPWWVTFAVADFNGDGMSDLALGGRGLSVATAGPTKLAVRLATGGFGFDPAVYVNYSSAFDTYEFRAIGAGDYDADGDIDLAALTWAGRLLIFKNSGVFPYFDKDPVRVSNGGLDPPLIAGIGSETAAGPQLGESNIASQDLDGDGDLDLIVGVPAASASAPLGQAVVYFNDGLGGFQPASVKRNYTPFPTAARGVSGVAAADYDGDGDVDFYAGSPNSPTLEYFRNDGTGAFTSMPKMAIALPAGHGSCAFLRAGDLGNDGRMDFVVGTDGGANAPGGYVYWYRNSGTAVFTAREINGPAPLGTDLDSGAVGDFDGDGDLDVLAARGFDPATCTIISNDGFPGVHVLNGSVASKNLVGCTFITSDEAVLSATILVTDSAPALTNIRYFLSNSDDQNGRPLWEGPAAPGVKFTFQNPGDYLRWRAVLSTTDPTLTPTITELTVEYSYISKREYSRTSHAAVRVEIDSGRTGEEQVLYSASFEFPKWRGHLRSWDVTTLDLSPNRGSVLKNILAANAQPIADAGERLANRAASSRIVYTAYDAQGDGAMNDRLDFSASQSAILANYLQLGINSTEVPRLVDFVLGEGRAWKLGDINHSSPKALLPPSGIESMMGAGYNDFKQAHLNRPKLIFAGANDGMLHAFYAVTLDEAWAFIPNNLLYKLKSMKVMDPDCGLFLYHHLFVDGTPTVKDVYFGGAWHTVVVTGQGAGWGKNHDWYYFALDVTDPSAPQPLWEFTDAFLGETWSVPAVARIASPEKWVALFGSGYDSDGDPTVDIGHYFYCVDIQTGAVLKSFEIKENTEPASPFGIQNTLPGSPEAVDADKDGFADAVYFGDLKGRLWRIDLTGDVSTWKPAVIYRDPNMYPIITKPAIYVDAAASNAVHLYFGTGGDERAPADGNYSFVALIDRTLATILEWYMGPAALAGQLGANPDTQKAAFVPGEKVWADPIIGDRIIYVATLEGNIESLNPCRPQSGGGKIYARYMLGNQYGGSALQSELGSPVNYLQTEQRVRSAVTLGDTQIVNNSGQSQYMRKVFIQSYTQPGGGGPEPPSQVLAQPVSQSGLIIKSWREVYKVFKR